jgi:hypothetical protein
VPAPVGIGAVELLGQVARLEVDVEVGLGTALAAGDRAVDDEEVEPPVTVGRGDRAVHDLAILLREEGCQPLGVGRKPSVPALVLDLRARLVHRSILARYGPASLEPDWPRTRRRVIQVKLSADEETFRGVR